MIIYIQTCISVGDIFLTILHYAEKSMPVLLPPYKFENIHLQDFK